MRTRLLTTIYPAALWALLMSSCGKGTPPPSVSKQASAAVPSPPPAEAPAPQVSPQSAAPVAELQSHNLPAGTLITARLLDIVDSSGIHPGFVTATTIKDIKGSDGKLAIPSGSPLVIKPRYAVKTGPISTLRLGLFAITVGGRQYSMTDGLKDAATAVFTEDAGQGPAHSTVHLQYGTEIEFRLDRAVQLR